MPLIMSEVNEWCPTKDTQHIRDAQNPPSHIFWKRVHESNWYDMLVFETLGIKLSFKSRKSHCTVCNWILRICVFHNLTRFPFQAGDAISLFYVTTCFRGEKWKWRKKAFLILQKAQLEKISVHSPSARDKQHRAWERLKDIKTRLQFKTMLIL